MFVIVASTLLALACGPSEPDGADPAIAPATAERVVRGVDVGGTEAEVFLPPAGSQDTPVVVMLHGTLGDRTRMHALAESVAERGALVYVPSWPAIDMAQPHFAWQATESYRRQSEAVICALRRIRLEAGDLGGDPADVTLVGHSGGAMIGARVAVVDDPPWPGIDCDAGVPHAPDRFVGHAGDYEGRYQDAIRHHEQYADFDVFGLEPTNRDLEVWLVHGLNDTTTHLYVADRLVDHLVASGIAGRLVTTDWAHAEPLDPAEPAHRSLADLLAAIVSDGDGAPAADRVADASLSFDDEERCRYRGPRTFDAGDDLVIGLDNRTDVEIWFGLVSVRPGLEVAEAELLATGGGDLVAGRPAWVDAGGLVLVPPGATKSLRFAFVEADQPFVAYCHPDPEADHPRANWMYPSAVLTAADPYS